MTERPAGAFTRHDLGVTDFWAVASDDDQQAQRAWQDALTTRGDTSLAGAVFVSPLAAVFTDRLHIGAHSYIAAQVCLYGDVTLGENCTLNPFSEARGLVRIGDGVRVGAHTSILGFNHSMSPDEPIHRQPLFERGITIGDDVWIGSHAVILDGVTIGDHSVVGAGSVVTKDVSPWAIVAGNPARTVRDRRAPRRPAGTADLERRLSRLGDTAAQQARDLLERCWHDDARSGHYADRPGAAPTVRAWCDAVELADMLLGEPPPHAPADHVVDVLRSRQSPLTGLVPEAGQDDAEPTLDGHAPVNYHVLSVGYALSLLGSRFEHPVRSVADLSSVPLRTLLERLPWNDEGWRAGAWVDSVGTAMLWNRGDFSVGGEIETLIGWLTTRCDPDTGLWGRSRPDTGLLEPVNGTYRLIRGTFAQFGVPLPYPERTIDSVLAHASDTRWFSDGRGTACNVLDVIHPLRLAAKQTGHRRGEGEQWARRQLDRALCSWQDGAGFAFALEPGHGWDRTPGLLGTEMWLSITWLLADHVDLSEALGYRPHGVHRPEPATSLTFPAEELRP